MIRLIKYELRLIEGVVREFGFQAEMRRNKKTVDNVSRREETVCPTQECNT